MHPSYEIPPPIGYTPTQPPVPPPIGGAPINPGIPPIGGVEACPMIEHPTGPDVEEMVPSYPITPAVGYDGVHPATVIAPAMGSTPVSIIPQVAITPPIGGPSQHHGYLATDED